MTEDFRNNIISGFSKKDLSIPFYGYEDQYLGWLNLL